MCCHTHSYFVSYHPQALVKRSPSSSMGSTLKESSAFQSELRMPDSAIRHQNASPSDKGKVTICDGKPGDEDRPKKSSVCKSIEGCQEELLAQVVRENTLISPGFISKSMSLSAHCSNDLTLLHFLCFGYIERITYADHSLCGCSNTMLSLSLVKLATPGVRAACNRCIRTTEICPQT